MNKEEKTKLYSKLVETVKKTYLPRVELEKKKYGGIFLTDSDNLCEEINLYTYWQGVNYAKKTPPIKYLLVAQDWGALPVGQARFDYEKKLIAIKNGDNVYYYEKNLCSCSSCTFIFLCSKRSAGRQDAVQPPFGWYYYRYTWPYRF